MAGWGIQHDVTNFPENAAHDRGYCFATLGHGPATRSLPDAQCLILNVLLQVVESPGALRAWKEWQAKRPELFTMRVFNQTGPDTSSKAPAGRSVVSVSIDLSRWAKLSDDHPVDGIQRRAATSVAGLWGIPSTPYVGCAEPGGNIYNPEQYRTYFADVDGSLKQAFTIFLTNSKDRTSIRNRHPAYRAVALSLPRWQYDRRSPPAAGRRPDRTRSPPNRAPRPG